MKTIIAGSRHLGSVHNVYAAMQAIWPQSTFFAGDVITEVICGTARGADRAGATWANEMCVRVTEFPADWKKYGKAAGFLRNQEMATYGECLIAIWDGESRGTKDMIERAKKKGIPVYIYMVKQQEVADATLGQSAQTQSIQS